MANPKQKRTPVKPSPRQQSENPSNHRKGAIRLDGEKLKKAITEFQNEPDEKTARRQWKEIEQSIFGVRYDD